MIMILSPFFVLVTWVKKFRNYIKTFQFALSGSLNSFGINIVNIIG